MRLVLPHHNSSDLLVILRTNWIFLVIGPILVGVLVFLAINSATPLYTSSSYVSVDEAGAQYVDAFMNSPASLDRIVSEFSIAGDTIEARRLAVERRRRFSSAGQGKSTTANFFRFDVTDADPKQAQAMNAMLIAYWMDSMTAQANSRMAVDDLERIQQRFNTLAEVTGRVKTATSNATLPPVISSEIDRLLQAVIATRDEYTDVMTKLKSRKPATQLVAVFSAPTLPQEHTWPNRAMITILSAAAAEVVLLLFVLFREIWRNRGSNEPTSSASSG